MKKIEVFDGNELKYNIPTRKWDSSRCILEGVDINGTNASIELTDETFSQHLMFLGGIGTGKSNAIFQIVSQLRDTIDKNDVMIIFDSKGDFYDKFYKPGDVVISNDEKATGSNGADYWNILNEIELNDQMEENIIEISKSLFYEKLSKSSQPFFPNAAKDLFGAILYHFCEMNKDNSQNNATLRKFLESATPTVIKEILSLYPKFGSMSSYIEQDKSPQTQGVHSELQQLFREIFVGNFKKAGSLSLRKLVRQKGAKVIFIEYDLGIGNMLTPIYRLLLDMAIKEALSRSKSEGNVWIIADEFKLTPNLQHIDDAVNFGRSMGVKIIIGIQNVEQIYHAYGEERAKSILSGFQTSISFRVNDYETREYIKSLYGKNRKKETYLSAVAGRGVTEQIRDANVVEDWDIDALKRGESIIGINSDNPVWFKFKKYQE